jgi:hypothetical protein
LGGAFYNRQGNILRNFLEFAPMVLENQTISSNWRLMAHVMAQFRVPNEENRLGFDGFVDPLGRPGDIFGVIVGPDAVFVVGDMLGRRRVAVIVLGDEPMQIESPLGTRNIQISGTVAGQFSPFAGLVGPDTPRGRQEQVGGELNQGQGPWIMSLDHGSWVTRSMSPDHGSWIIKGFLGGQRRTILKVDPEYQPEAENDF